MSLSSDWKIVSIFSFDAFTRLAVDAVFDFGDAVAVGFWVAHPSENQKWNMKQCWTEIKDRDHTENRKQNPKNTLMQLLKIQRESKEDTGGRGKVLLLHLAVASLKTFPKTLCRWLTTHHSHHFHHSRI